MRHFNVTRTAPSKSHWLTFASATALGAAASLAVSGLAAAQTIAPAAQPAAAGPAGSVEEIVVTARRVEERLQDVPTSVSALGSKELDARRVLNAADLSGVTPNLVLRQVGESNFSASIRGVTAGGLTNQTLDAGISIYLDGVYIGRGVQALSAVTDISQVEVLRGPQGTLFGRNVTGGAISFTTKEPPV
jgi:iron complex outermembrane receptor protein